MKHAGLMKPPVMMTQDVYEYIISQVAANYVKALNRKVREYKKYREKEEERYEPLLTVIEEIREVVETRGTRDIFNKYKELVSMSYRFFGMGYISELKQKSFSGVKDPEKRKSVKELVENNIQPNLEAMENRLSYGERQIPSLKEKIKGFKKLITVKLKPMKKGEIKDVKFPIYLDEWYVDQKSLEEHREMIVDVKTKMLKKTKERLENKKLKMDQGLGRFENYTKEEMEEELIELQEDLDSVIERANNLENEIESLSSIKVRIEVSKENPYWQAGTLTFSMPIVDAEERVDSSGLIPEPRATANHIHRVVVHEMTHVGQTILSFIALKIKSFFGFYSSKALAGRPSKSIRTPQYKQDQATSYGGSKDQLGRHHLDDVEFYTDLRDATRLIMEKMKYHEKKGIEYGNPLKPQDKNLLFKALTGQQISREERRRSDFLSYVNPIEFFLTLKRKAKPKYFKAVGEAYKLVFGSFAHQRMAKRIARVHLERKKWVEAPAQKFDQDQQEQIWTIYDLSYSKVGKHISSKSALMSNYDIFWVVDVDGDDEIDAFVSYNSTRFGKKIGLIGSDGTSEGRNAMLTQGAGLLLKRGWYAEVDSRFARLLKKRLGVNHIQDEDQVRAIINKPLEWDDNKKCYTRNLEGKGDVVKYLVGLPTV